MNDFEAASEIIDRVIVALHHRDRRVACPRPCPIKKAQKKTKGKHVCELIQGDGMTPLERIRNASPAQVRAQRLDREGGRTSGTSDPTGRVAQQMIARGPDDEARLRVHFASASNHLGIAVRLARRDVPRAMRREQARHAKAARKAAHECDLIVMRWGPPQPSSDADRKRLAQANTTAPPDCQCCGEPVLMVGSAALETDAGGNLPTKGPTCDWCIGIARQLGKAPTKKMVNDHKAGRRVRIVAANHLDEAS